MEIGPQIPSHILATVSKHDGDGDGGDNDEYGPPPPPETAGRPAQSPRAGSSRSPPHPPDEDEDENEQEDAYTPALPPDFLTQHAPQRRTIGPALPAPPSDDSEEEEVGPMPAPAGTETHGPEDAVDEFIAREQRRAAAAAEAANAPKKLVREEWMLVPPTSSGVLGSLDPTKLKARQFSRSARPDVSQQDSSLWTETPAERHARIKDEVHGKRRRATDTADADIIQREGDYKRRRHDEAITAQVAQYNQETRSQSLVDLHKSSKETSQDADKDTPIWDHARDMSVGGRLMDDAQRSKVITDARGLGDRFGKGKSGGWL